MKRLVLMGGLLVVAMVAPAWAQEQFEVPLEGEATDLLCGQSNWASGFWSQKVAFFTSSHAWQGDPVKSWSHRSSPFGRAGMI